MRENKPDPSTIWPLIALAVIVLLLGLVVSSQKWRECRAHASSFLDCVTAD